MLLWSKTVGMQSAKYRLWDKVTSWFNKKSEETMKTCMRNLEMKNGLRNTYINCNVWTFFQVKKQTTKRNERSDNINTNWIGWYYIWLNKKKRNKEILMYCKYCVHRVEIISWRRLSSNWLMGTFSKWKLQ